MTYRLRKYAMPVGGQEKLKLTITQQSDRGKGLSEKLMQGDDKVYGMDSSIITFMVWAIPVSRSCVQKPSSS